MPIGRGCCLDLDGDFEVEPGRTITIPAHNPDSCPAHGPALAPLLVSKTVLPPVADKRHPLTDRPLVVDAVGKSDDWVGKRRSNGCRNPHRDPSLRLYSPP